MSRFLLCLAIASALAAAGPAQDFGKPIQGQVQIGLHEFTLSPDSAYIVRLSSRKYLHDLYLGETFTQVGATTYPDEKGAQNETGVRELFCSPVKECKVAVRVTPAGGLPGGPQPYTLVVERHKLSKKPLLQVKGKLTAKDRPAPDKSIGKHYPVQLVKGRLYVAEMTIDAKGELAAPGFGRAGEPADWSNFLTGSEKRGHPARCVFRPKYDGKYHAMAELFGDVAEAGCSYTLTVYQETKD
ncbi:MAG TPA: hypothetical protein VEL76_03990 [Gemmataceae bacterium]|nr:hypothetical protein [Gemmataceae bacterium]